MLPPLADPLAALPIVTSMVVAVGTSVTSKSMPSKSASVKPIPKAVTPETPSRRIISPSSAPWAVDVVRVTEVVPSKVKVAPVC